MNTPEQIFKIQAQKIYAAFPTIILGSGASAAFGLSGMGALAKYLIENVPVEGFTTEDNTCWGNVCTKLNENIDLETAMHQAPLTDNVAEQIVLTTWSLLNPQDIATFKQSLNDNEYFPLGKLIKGLFSTTHNRVNIITTNYDRLAEYACEQAGYRWFTGFSHGFKRTIQDDGYFNKNERVVNIWKVHGSLDWFKLNHQIMGIYNSVDIPEQAIPQIVTPGIAKYRQTHLEPYRDIIAKADAAINKSKSFLCIGFGFNDEHIQPKLKARCIQQTASIVVLTWALTDATKNFLFKNPSLQYLAIERGDNDQQSKVYSSEFPEQDPIIIDADHWSLNGFLSIII